MALDKVFGIGLLMLLSQLITFSFFNLQLAIQQKGIQCISQDIHPKIQKYSHYKKIIDIIFFAEMIFSL